MSLFGNIGKAIGHAVHDVGHAIGSAATTVAHGVEHAAVAVAHGVEHVAVDVAKDVAHGVDAFAHEVAKDAGAVVHAVTNLHLPSIPLGHMISTPGILKDLFGTTRPEMDKFVKSTADFRATLATLKTTPPSDPRYQAAAAHLKAQYGYTPENAPKPGAQWVSPRLSGDLVPGGYPNAATWPSKPASSEPPAAIDALFAYGHKPTLTMPDGTERTIQSPEEYRAVIAQNRATLGITKPDGSPAGGEPIGVHVTMEGGGGKGKRYSPAFAEMYSMGIVPTSVSGTSVGAVAAGYIAAGADPKTVAQLASDPAVSSFFDFKLGGSGLMDGKNMYHYLDQKLRDLTGIHDRPVMFSDLKMPLHLLAAIMSDSAPPAGTDYTKPQNRVFVFSQETTPDTPVAYAMLASGAEPMVLPTVDLVDPSTGRKLVLTDSGVLDGLPMDYGKPNLPEIGLSLQEPHDNHPAEHTEGGRPLPPGDIDTSNPVVYGLNSLELLKESGTQRQDFLDRTQPKKGEFMLAVPVFNLDDARLEDESLIFKYRDNVDPALDAQGRKIARDFFVSNFNKLTDPNASATNLVTAVPADTSFTRMLDYNGTRYTASYSGGDKVHFVSGDGKSLDLDVGKHTVEGMLLDEKAYGGHLVEGELKVELEKHFNILFRLRHSLPI